MKNILLAVRIGLLASLGAALASAQAPTQASTQTAAPASLAISGDLAMPLKLSADDLPRCRA